jgi:hypothetical protein
MDRPFMNAGPPQQIVREVKRMRVFVSLLKIPAIEEDFGDTV